MARYARPIGNAFSVTLVSLLASLWLLVLILILTEVAVRIQSWTDEGRETLGIMVASGAVVISAVAAYFTARQAQAFRKQLADTVRPFLVLDQPELNFEGKAIADPPDVVQRVRNSGQIPAQIDECRFWLEWPKDRISDDIEVMGPQTGALMPNDTRTILLRSEHFDSLWNGTSELKCEWSYRGVGSDKVYSFRRRSRFRHSDLVDLIDDAN